MAEPITDVTDATFESEVLQTDATAIVGFWADWCGPCRAVAPVVEELAATHADDLRVLLLDVDDNPQTPSHYGIKSIPTFLRFVDGEVVDRLVGAVPRDRVEQLFEG